ncbi:antitoxin [Allorhizocola rhizosphaerae]|uniref:antitoxin n=1 Tax=Allorhizocola rhizosphaerae TaxID=1872709 RepID=UPI000E3E08DF|nr:antitoxin [Allorhizocola rhizosphaerae]
MGIMDQAKNALGLNEDEDAKGKSTGAAEKAKNRAKEAVGKAGDAVDQKTGGRGSGQVDALQEKANEYIDKRTQAS